MEPSRLHQQYIAPSLILDYINRGAEPDTHPEVNLHLAILGLAELAPCRRREGLRQALSRKAQENVVNVSIDAKCREEHEQQRIMKDFSAAVKIMKISRQAGRWEPANEQGHRKKGAGTGNERHYSRTRNLS